jgi:hypothetical protein
MNVHTTLRLVMFVYMRTLATNLRQRNNTFESICGTNDESVEAKCLAGSPMYGPSKAVLRLWIRRKDVGLVFCTGWLLGCEGHFMTNHHCIASEYDANNTLFEFMAQGNTCNMDCAAPGACTTQPSLSSSPAFIAASNVLDYALLKLHATPPLGLG